MSGASDSGEDLPSTDPEFLRVRARTYDLLAACLDGDIDVLAGAAESDDFARLSSALPVDLNFDRLADYDSEVLEVGYDNLFAVPGPHYVPPFASAYATDPAADYESDSTYHMDDDGGELLGEPAADLSQLYAAAGFDPTRGDGIPDHVAAVFEFLGALAEVEADRREAGNCDDAEALRDLQRRTLDSLGWLDEFHERVREADSVEGAFARLAGVARTFAAWDARAGVGAHANSTRRKNSDRPRRARTEPESETTNQRS